MSAYVRIFCATPRAVTRRDIAELVAEENFFDSPPVFKPPPGSAEAAEPEWDKLDIIYDTGKRPVRVERNLNDELLAREKEELREALQEVDDDEARQDLLAWLDDCALVFAFELDSAGATEPALDMVDYVAAHLAQYLDGFVYEEDGGFYNGQLEPIYEFE
ncbi:MAG TPA: hypothetical protein VGV38_13035 [Pyrinomonadaceae bacterium]|nr:hypothetical protein [Pyrinomonadaceae bacterium]